MFNRSKKVLKQFDWPLFLITIALCIFGVVILNSATANIGNSVRQIFSQIAATFLGLFVICVFLFVDMDALKRLAIPIYIICILLLLATLLLGGGKSEWGANSWISIGPLSFQPSEFVKIGMVISLAAILEKFQHRMNKPIVLLGIGVICLLPVYLINRQPDLGTAAVFVFFMIAMLFYAGLHWGYIVAGAILVVVAAPLVYNMLSPGQQDRILNFLDPTRDPMSSSYQILQGIIAIGSGKFSGQGYLKGMQTQNGFIPEQETDYIFAVLSEEFGFIGGTLLIILYFLYLLRMILLAKRAKDLFGALICIGIGAMFFIHVFENIGMTIGLMPVTGIPLPYMSYGGTFQLINLIGTGLVLSAGMQRKPLDFNASP